MAATELLTHTEAMELQPWELLADGLLAELTAEVPPALPAPAAKAAKQAGRRRRTSFARALYGGGVGGGEWRAAPFHVRA